MAVAAAFGFDVSPDLLASVPADGGTEASAEDDGADVAASSVIAAAKALGVGAATARSTAPPRPARPIEAPGPIPAAAETAAGKSAGAERMASGESEAVKTAKAAPMAASAVPAMGEVSASEDLPAPAAVVDAAAADAAATADKLEAALLGQLRVLEETLQPTRPRGLPLAAQLRPAASADRPVVLRAEPAGAPGRSPFAPDPVRQRTYVDLRDPSPQPAASDDAPWRKYLDDSRPVPPPPTRVRRVSSRPIASRPSTAAVIDDRRRAGDERGGLRAMSLAAVLGLGVGLGLLVLARPFAEPTPAPATAVVDDPVPVAIASADGAASGAGAPGAVDEALATLLADPPEVQHSGPAVIAEVGTPPEELVAEAVPISPPVAEPPLIRPPVGQPIQVARAAPVYGPEAPPTPLAYGPTAPSYDPVRQSLFADDGKAAATEGGDVAPKAERAAAPRGDRATVRSFVNMRARPDNGAAVVAVLAQGLSVKVLGCDYWCEIEAGGKRGYVYKKFVGR